LLEIRFIVSTSSDDTVAHEGIGTDRLRGSYSIQLAQIVSFDYLFSLKTVGLGGI
jgi:hypothetical protein